MTTITKPVLTEKLQLSQLDLYSHGDPGLRQKLIELMIENILELQHALSASIDQCKPDMFRKTCHKVTTTLSIINSLQLIDLVDDLKSCADDSNKVESFNQVCETIVMSLHGEKELLRVIHENRETK